MEIQAGSHNGDLNRFPKHITQQRSKPVHTREIQAGPTMPKCPWWMT